MLNMLPGTAVEMDRRAEVADFLRSLFAAGGLVLSQVLQLTGLNAHTVQNWVKRKYLKPPDHKKYDCAQLCTVAILNLLGGTFSFESIRRMLDYAELLCEDAPVHIYTLFVESLGDVAEPGAPAGERAERAARSRAEKLGLGADARERLTQVVKIMLLAHFSAEMRLNAQELLYLLDT